MDLVAELTAGALYWYAGTLDTVPDYVRAMIAGALLASLLRFSQAWVPEREVQFSISFSKVALIALMAVPVVVGLLPQSRLVVLVEKLEPVARPLDLVWAGLLALWGIGFLLAAARLLHGYVVDAVGCRRSSAVADDHPLAGRLRHWQRRLGMSRPLLLVLAEGEHPRHVPGTRRIVLPRSAAHWPAAARDLLIIQELCRKKKHHGRWHLFAQLVSCCYWPVSWVRRLDDRLLADFDVVTDNLAEACYEDPLGYRRALRQIEQRMAVPASAHTRREGALWGEPGEKLALLIGHAVFVALVFGGVTLREMPPEVERDYSLTLDGDWMKTAFRQRGGDGESEIGVFGGDAPEGRP